MKKIAAILLIAIFAFNTIGFHLVSSYFANKADMALEKSLDANDYSDNDLISIKLPTSLPYYSNNKNFERIDGEVDVKGIKYKYVKYRIYNDSLEMLCIPNTQKMNIEVSKNNYAKVIFDFQQDNKKKSGEHSNKSFQKNTDYVNQQQPNEFNNLVVGKNNFPSFITVSYKNNYLDTTEQPPDVA